jgi:hypothetical protein
MENATTIIEKLRKGDITRITELLQGKYARRTVEAQLKGERTLQPEVKAAALAYIEAMEALKTQSQPA